MKKSMVAPRAIWHITATLKSALRLTVVVKTQLAKLELFDDVQTLTDAQLAEVVAVP